MRQVCVTWWLLSIISDHQRCTAVSCNDVLFVCLWSMWQCTLSTSDCCISSCCRPPPHVHAVHSVSCKVVSLLVVIVLLSYYYYCYLFPWLQLSNRQKLADDVNSVLGWGLWLGVELISVYHVSLVVVTLCSSYTALSISSCYFV